MSGDAERGQSGGGDPGSGPSAEGFTERVRSALAVVDGVVVEVLRPLALTVEAGGRRGTLDLTSGYRRLQHQPERLDEIVAQAVATLPEATAAAALDPAAILPMARTLDDLARLAQGRTGGVGRTRPLVGELVLSLVLDGQYSVRPLSDWDADRLGLSDDDLWRQALDNLGRRPISVEGDGRVRQALAGGDYDATCLAHPRLRAALPEGTLAAAPCRGVLLLGADGSRATRRELSELAQQVFETRPHPLSTALLRWSGGQWTVCAPAAGSRPR